MNKIFIKKPGITTLVMVVVNTGAFNEYDLHKGISHFIEHLCFKGNPKRNQKQISSAIDNVGGDLNAYTDWEITAYWAKVGNSYKDLAVEVITDLATKPLFPEKEINKEREVIIQELKMYEDDAKSYVYEAFNKQLYSKYSGFYLPIVGTIETLHNIKRKQLLEYYQQKYNNPTLIIIGDVENRIEINKPYNIENISSKVSKEKKDILISRNNLTQANILIGNSVKVFPDKFNKIEQMFCLYLLDAVYGDMSGRLFDVIREKYNMVYRVRFERELYSNNTIQWNVSAGLDAKNINKARELIVKELKRPISKKDIEIALTKSIGIEEMQLDNIVNIGNIIAYSLVKGIDFGELIFIHNCKKNLKRATELINDFIKELNFEDNILVGIIPEEIKKTRMDTLERI